MSCKLRCPANRCQCPRDGLMLSIGHVLLHCFSLAVFTLLSILGFLNLMTLVQYCCCHYNIIVVPGSV